MNISSPRPRSIAVAFMAGFFAFLIGCGGGNDRKNLILTGKVSYKGSIVSGGTIKLIPTDTKIVPVTSQINPNGTYSVVPTGLGDMKVAIETESIKGQTGAAYNVPAGKKGLPEITDTNLPKYVTIPGKYADVNTSGLTVTIQKGKNEKNFELTD